jgi:hypothetical protein
MPDKCRGFGGQPFGHRSQLCRLVFSRAHRSIASQLGVAGPFRPASSSH